MVKFLNTNLLKFKIYSLIFCAFLLYSSSTYAQDKDKIRLINSELLESATHNGKKARKLKGNVQFAHQDAIMYCDSAFMYIDENSIDAYGNVQINQGDSLKLFGDYLHYNGDSRIANMQGKKVQLIKPDLTLTTTSIIFDRTNNIASYSNKGYIESKADNNTLESIKGYYQTDYDIFTFRDSVVLKNPEFIMNADTLIFHNSRSFVEFAGPTTISSEENFIYCEAGWYDTGKDLSAYYDSAYMISDGRKLEGDSLFYDRKNGLGRAVQNIQITDTAENIQINGNYALLYEKNDSAIVFDKSLLTQIFNNDSLFMHADTFKVFNNEEGDRTLFAYYGVKIFKEDLQGVCDSMVYSITDSTIRLRGKPVLWSEDNQMTAEIIDIHTKENKMDYIYLENESFIISAVDSIRYNQIKGKQMHGYFKNSELDKIEVRGNGQTTYYALDDEDKFIGVNVAESRDLDIQIKNQEIHTISFLSKPDATMHPMGELDPIYDLRYPGFKWLIDLRPKSKEDLFRATIVD